METKIEQLTSAGLLTDKDTVEGVVFGRSVKTSVSLHESTTAQIVSDLLVGPDSPHRAADLDFIARVVPFYVQWTYTKQLIADGSPPKLENFTIAYRPNSWVTSSPSAKAILHSIARAIEFRFLQVLSANTL